MNQVSNIATNIIKGSIASTIWIDDKLVGPYSEITADNKSIWQNSKNLYDSFRKENKSIDFYKYENNTDWQQDVEYLFKNRDLLVLDWSLNESLGLKQPDTLKILKRAVQTDSLHFVTIYTETPSKQFEDIFYSLKAFFNPYYSHETVALCEGVISSLDNEGIDTAFLGKLSSLFKEYSLSSGSQKESTYKTLKGAIQDELKDNYKLFVQGLKKVNNDLDIACELLGYLINKEDFIENTSFEPDINTKLISEQILVVNHTIIQITNKQDPKPEELFQSFTEAIQKVCGNLLTLISLEIRSLLRESSGFVGKDADSIDDVVLFHQKSNKESFLDFLMSILRSHTFSSFNYRSGKLKSVQDNFWDEYDKEKTITPLISALEKDEPRKIEQLLKLNVYYNELHIQKKQNDIVKFGDIFYSVQPNGKSDGSFFLCVTAHCDCLKPQENIKNNFFFILGQRADGRQLLKDGDSEFNSYIRFNNEIIGIKWNPRPIVLQIANNKVTDTKIVAIDGLNKNYDLSYLSTLKENYAQRMANNSFAFAMRVGIDFATF